MQILCLKGRTVSGVSQLHSLVFLNALPKCMQTSVASAAYNLLDQCSPEMQAGHVLYFLEPEEVGSQQHPRVYSIIMIFFFNFATQQFVVAV